MGEIAGRDADLAVVTSDNPRSEDPAAIVAQVVEGLRRAGGRELSADQLAAAGRRAATTSRSIAEPRSDGQRPPRAPATCC